MKKLLLPFCVLFSVWGNAQTITYYNTANTSTELVDNVVNDIEEDIDGSIWFATSEGASHLTGSIWNNYLQNDGLASRAVNAIAIDKKGVKWFATTEGVSKLENGKWTIFNKENSRLYWSNITSVSIDSYGNKWFSSYEGVCKYNDTTWTFFSGMYPELKDIRCITIDSLGHVWVGIQNGVAKFNGNYWTVYKSDELYDTSPNTTLSISIDKKGRKLIGTQHWTYMLDSTGYHVYLPLSDSKIVAINKLGEEWGANDTWIAKSVENKYVTQYYSKSSVQSMIFDSQSNLWVGTSNGVLKFDGSEWTTYKMNGLQSNDLSSMDIEQNGNKWFGTYIGKVSTFEGSRWINYDNTNSILKGEIQAIKADQFGNKWFGTRENGLFKYNDTSWTNFNESYPYTLKDIKSIVTDDDQNTWIGTYFRLFKLSGQEWNPEFLDLPSGDIRSIAVDDEGNKWIGTTEGLSKYDGKQVINYTTDNGLIHPVVYSIAIDGQGNKWIGTYYALSKFDGYTWTHYNDPNLFGGRLVEGVDIDSDGNVWIAINDSLIKFDGISFEKYPYQAFQFIKIDDQGNKWFMSSDGVQNSLAEFSDGGSARIKHSHIQRGIVFNDLNANGKKDLNESNISGQIVKVDNNYTTTQNNGLFYTSLNNGTHTFTYRPQANWQLTTDSSITVNVTDAPIKDSLFFGVQAIVNKHEVETKLTGTATRAGFESKSWINYTNRGTLVENGTVSYTLADEASLFQSTPVADSTIGKRLVWKYSSLIPNEQRQISITTRMPGVNYLGDTLVSISKIKSDFSSFSDTLKQVLTGSYDPNDKLVAQGIGNKGYVLFGKELEYTVRFQNTGTDTAFNVNIRDTLDLNLDVASLQIVASSHPVKLDLRGQNEATFRFENILLPHQKRDDLGSNGFVKYTINPKKNLAENTPVKNKAYIYFDFNPAIITKETENTYVSKLPSLVTGIQGFQSNESATIFPNPAKDEFTIVFPQSGTYEVSLANIQGKSIKTWNEIVGQESAFSVEDVEPGMYLYTAQGRNGQKYMGKLVVGR